jgi:hypothetical protein
LWLSPWFLPIKTTLMTEQLDLTDQEKRALIALLRETLEIRSLSAGAAPRPAKSDPGGNAAAARVRLIV